MRIEIKPDAVDKEQLLVIIGGVSDKTSSRELRKVRKALKEFLSPEMTKSILEL